MSFLRLRRVAILLTKILTFLLVGVVILLLLGFSLLETTWGKDRLRELIVQQANQRLTATLDIGRFGGSIFRGVQLDNIRLSRDGHPIISIDQASIGYSIRQLYEHGAIIQHVRLVRPRIVAGKQPDGRWNLGALIRRETN